MKNYFIQSAKVIILGVLLVGLSSFAQWTTPTGGFPATNKPAPLNVSALGQAKSGSLWVGGLAVFGTTTGAALLNDTANVMNASKLFVSGKINIGANPPSGLDYSGENLLNIDGSIKTSSLAHAASPFNLRPVCQTGGVLNLCAIPTPTSLPTGSITYSTPGTYNFQVPLDITSVTIKTWGAGGGGLGGSGSPCCMNFFAAGGSRGYGGLFNQATVSVTAGSQLSVVVGAGGVGGPGGPTGGAPSGPGVWGGQSKVSTIPGGVILSSANGGPGGSTVLTGIGGENGTAGAGGGGAGGAGGLDPGCNNMGNQGANGSGPGGGGGGGSGGRTCDVWGGAHSGGNGGNGASGQVIISW